LKAIFIQDTISSGGAERSHLEIIAGFSRDTKASIVYFYEGHELKSAHDLAGIPLHFLNLRGKYDFVKGINKLLKLINKEKPDILVSCLLRASLMARFVSVMTSVPLVGTLVNDSYGEARVMEKKDGAGFWKFKFFWMLDRLTAGIPRHWIANAKSIAMIHVNTLGLDSSKISVIHRGRKTDVPQWEKKRGSGFIFLSYGRLIERKGFAELILAFNEVRKEYPAVKLVIYGEGPERSNLEILIARLNLQEAVSLPGLSHEVHHKLTEVNCFAFPSWYEGFSGALVEAMLAGIPIIASDIPMNLEAITPGHNALTFKVKSVEDLASKMEYAISHQEEMALMGEHAREEAMRRFNISVIAAQYEKLLHEIQLMHK
jgi:glycosyltransferase involved in cell wall biosynthesis